QTKMHNPEKTAKYAEAVPKEDAYTAAARRTPAWTSAWGNQPLLGLTNPVVDLQARGIVSRPGDPYEQKADQIAGQVMDRVVPGTNTTAPPVGSLETSSHLAMSASHIQPMVQRFSAEEDTSSTPVGSENAPTTETGPTEYAQASDMSKTESVQ